MVVRKCRYIKAFPLYVSIDVKDRLYSKGKTKGKK